jgi:Patatin-like phospholipase
VAKLRMSLTLPGAVSLGSYEGGALAALLIAAQTLGDDVLLIDSIAAASAGSITGLLASRALLRGTDPVDLMRQAWVEQVSLAAMHTDSTDSPLSSNALTGIAQNVLGPGGDAEKTETGYRRTEPVLLSMALASLAGLRYQLKVRDGDPIPAATYLDWYDVTITSAEGSADYVRFADAAIASGANALGFPAKLLDRSADRVQYDEAGLEGFPADGKMWYTDGGTVNNEPLGRTIDLAQRIDSDDPRLYLLIHPDPSAPTAQPAAIWSGDSPLPPWIRTGTHAFGLTRSQTIFDDIRRLAQINDHLARSTGVSQAVAQGLQDAAANGNLSPADVTAINAGVTAAVLAQLSKLPTPPALDNPVTLEAAIDALVQTSTGLDGKDQVTVEIVSPLIDPRQTEPPAKQLAGAFFFHFGGFIDIKYRQSDFALGYRNMEYWLINNLPRYLPGVELQTAIRAVDDAYAELGWDDIRHGGATLGDISLHEKLELGRVAEHLGHVLLHDADSGDV